MKHNAQIERSARVRVLGKSTMRCEKCLADCSADGSWVVDGLCSDHRKPKAKQ